MCLNDCFNGKCDCLDKRQHEEVEAIRTHGFYDESHLRHAGRTAKEASSCLRPEDENAERIAREMLGAIVRDFNAEQIVKIVSIIKNGAIDYLSGLRTQTDHELCELTKLKNDRIHILTDAISIMEEI